MVSIMSMREIIGRNLGFCKPTTGPVKNLPYVSMAKGETRKEKIEAALLRAILATNVEFLAKQKLPGRNVPNEIADATKVSRVNPVSRAHAQRILKRNAGVSLEMLQALADGFGVKPFELLDPDLEGHYIREAANAKRQGAGAEKEKAKPANRTGRARRNAPPAVS